MTVTAPLWGGVYSTYEHLRGDPLRSQGSRYANGSIDASSVYADRRIHRRPPYLKETQ